jgi:hypothetical protein
MPQGIDSNVASADNKVRGNLAMTIQVEVSPEVEARLNAEAVVRGIAPEAYAGHLLQQVLESQASGTGALTQDEARTTTQVLIERSANLPVLPVEATERASYYEDRF